jgi:hypothetical protein
MTDWVEQSLLQLNHSSCKSYIQAEAIYVYPPVWKSGTWLLKLPMKFINVNLILNHLKSAMRSVQRTVSALTTCSALWLVTLNAVAWLIIPKVPNVKNYQTTG